MMSEPSSGVPDEIADTDVDEAADGPSDGRENVDLDLDEEKLEKWNEVKSDYQMDPDGKPMPNIWDAGEVGESEPEHDAELTNEGQGSADGVFESGEDPN